MAAPIYRFHRGEPIVIGREVISGDPAGYTVRADMKKTNGQIIPPAGAAVFASFTVTFQAAEAGAPARWLLTIDGEATSAFAVGHYAVDAVFELDGVVAGVTAPAIIQIVESVTG